MNLKYIKTIDADFEIWSDENTKVKWIKMITKIDPISAQDILDDLEKEDR